MKSPLSIKVFLLAVVVTAALANRPNSPNPIISNQIRRQAEVVVAKAIVNELQSRLERDISRGVSVGQNQNPMGTLLPPIADPACLEPQEFPLNFTIPSPLIEIYGPLALTSPATVTGLSKAVDDFNLTYVALNGALKINWDFEIPVVDIVGEYDMDLTLDLGSQHKILGGGNFSASVESVFFRLRANGNAPAIIGKMKLVSLDVDLGFSNLKINGGEGFLDATPINWVTIGDFLQNYLDAFWNDETRPLINEMVRCSIDHLVNDCNIAKLINGTTECLKTELSPACFEEESLGALSVKFQYNKITLSNSCRANTETTVISGSSTLNIGESTVSDDRVTTTTIRTSTVPSGATLTMEISRIQWFLSVFFVLMSSLF